MGPVSVLSSWVLVAYPNRVITRQYNLDGTALDWEYPAKAGKKGVYWPEDQTIIDQVSGITLKRNLLVT